MNKLYLLFVFLLLFHTHGKGQNALLIPPELSGTRINLTLKYGTHQFYSGYKTATMGVNGNILGPTLILHKGDFVDFKVHNLLKDITTMHWHGLHVAPENDGGPHTIIAPKTTWTPSFTILNKAATCWYHPHLHRKTNEHVSKGIAGLIIIKDEEEALLSLPRTYGIDDFPLIIQTKDFDNDNEIIVHSNADDVVMVNATINPFLKVPAQVVRYRILNGSSQRSFNIGLSNNKSYYQIASDGGLLEKPIKTTRLLISPAERVEILIDFTGMNKRAVNLKSFASELRNGIYGASNPGMMSRVGLAGYKPNPLNGIDFNILQYNVVEPTNNPIKIIPPTLVSDFPPLERDAHTTRRLIFSPAVRGFNQLNGKFLINGTSFNMNTINYTVPIGSIEIWELTNQSAISHPFHIHDVHFYILTRNGRNPGAHEQGPKDVVLVQPRETVRFITQFDDFTNPNVPYMYHCHLLTHEDDGMMGQFIVNNKPISVINTNLGNGLVVHPNPSHGEIQITVAGGSRVKDIKIYDVLGKCVMEIPIQLDGEKIRIKGLSRGLFLLRVNVNTTTITKKLIVY